MISLLTLLELDDSSLEDELSLVEVLSLVVVEVDDDDSDTLLEEPHPTSAISAAMNSGVNFFINACTP